MSLISAPGITALPNSFLALPTIQPKSVSPLASGVEGYLLTLVQMSGPPAVSWQSSCWANPFSLVNRA